MALTLEGESMTQAEQLAAFAVRASYEDLSEAARGALKVRVLDALGCGLGALDAPLLRLIRAQAEEFGGAGLCTLVGGGRTAPDRAAFYNTALVRYLDFSDAYLAPGETCHPSDNLAPVLAAAEFAGAGGRDFLAALAVAYQVQCRLSDVAPVRAKGFDHTTHGSFAVAAGASRALGLDQRQAANAIGICGASFNTLRVTRTGALSHWKGLASANTAFGCTHAAFLARRGVTGPREVFEGNKGFMDAVSGRFEIDWGREDLEQVTRTILKRYNAEIHSQSAIECALELRQAHPFTAAEVRRIDLDIFPVAYHIIGGGEEGGKHRVRTKEEADHSLPYLLAVALLDGQVLPEQYRPERIGRPDVQALLGKVSVRPDADFGRRFPAEMPCRLRVTLADGRTLALEKPDYEGFLTRPMGWDHVARKFHDLSKRAADASLRAEIVAAVAALEAIPVADLCRLLARVRTAEGSSHEGSDNAPISSPGR
jgi:2-methylcitrate dehydratase